METRSRPLCFASYIATSARSISRQSPSAATSPSPGRTSATPIEAVTCRDGELADTARRRRSAS
jgi:hypothetical protein